VFSRLSPDRYSVVLWSNPHRGRILVSVAFCESDLRADHVANEREKSRIREIATDGAESSDHVSHQRFVGAGFAGYPFSIELGQWQNSDAF
jgi:hypothetical protein